MTSTIHTPGEGYHFDRRVIRWSWRELAACATTLDRDQAEGFFPLANNLAVEARAKQVCTRCPVRGECLADALLGRHTYEIGVRGGLSATERAELTDEQREALIAPYATAAPGSEE
ncbi:WhiB family transcriptional regulator [Amycolatopsis australiensis]|uniref:WhiB family transcriptional regulator n=1 Tax=Amycolatopsis australiensis TaxID=546364 RepID=UPI002481F6A5|nr:WhiB family transcriptional regulator [Amycolatopsis australiensis]